MGMSKKRIAFIVNSNIYSGLEKVVVDIMLFFKDEYDMIYVTQRGSVIGRLDDFQIPYYIVSDISVKSIRRFIKEWHPELIHAQDFTASVISCLCFKNVICHLHNNPPWMKQVNMKSLAYLFVGLKSREILVVSEAIREEFIFEKLIRKKFICVHNPVNMSVVIEQAGKKTEKVFDVCCVGRIVPQKNPIVFIQIMNEVSKMFPEIKACWVGDGELKEKCLKRVSELGLEKNIQFLGYKDNPYPIIRASKLFVLPSSWEGFGLVAFEALSLGVPCIVSKVGGLQDIVDENCGILCLTVEDFTKAIISLLSDSTKRRLLSESAYDRAKRLDNKDEYMNRLRESYVRFLR